jgi:hypothetical protein
MNTYGLDDWACIPQQAHANFFFYHHYAQTVFQDYLAFYSKAIFWEQSDCSVTPSDHS